MTPHNLEQLTNYVREVQKSQKDPRLLKIIRAWEETGDIPGRDREWLTDNCPGVYWSARGPGILGVDLVWSDDATTEEIAVWYFLEFLRYQNPLYRYARAKAPELRACPTCDEIFFASPRTIASGGVCIPCRSR